MHFSYILYIQNDIRKKIGLFILTSLKSEIYQNLQNKSANIKMNDQPFLSETKY